jgi:tRNA(Ile2) C34 agmatinyltransferase TiaS
VHRLLDYKEHQLCPACSGRMADSTSNPELQCIQCGLTQPYASGDQVLMDDLEAVAREIGLPERPSAPERVSSTDV